MKEKKLKHNFWSILKTIGMSIITLSVLLGVAYILKLEKGFLPYLLIIFFIFDFPAWYLFISYFYKTKGKEVQVTDSYLFIFSQNKQINKYHLSEIEFVEYFKSKSETAFHPVMNYSYIKIKTSDNNVIYITCLMTSNLKLIVNQLGKKVKVRYGVPFLK